MAEHENIINVSIEDEMRGAYIDYSMSVIIARALPDVRDGLKPVHRRILYGMSDLGLTYNRGYKKSARIVGEVLGKYHPHGDSAVYDTMVRMAQPWSLRYPLVDGQGNFGSMDGDNAAAMRYTEARLMRISEEMLSDINKDVVDFRPNFDDSLQEPSVLPAKIPNLLLNGASGIAVGMATNMAPHNLNEVADGIMAYIDNNEITITELMDYIKAPDFPTGATIYGYQGIINAFKTGRGRIVMRAVADVETLKNGRERIVVTEIPYMVNKASLIQKAASLVNEKKIDGISAIRDESDRNGLRVVFDLKRDAIGNVVLNNLYKFTALQTSFSVNNIALVNGRPERLNLKDMIRHFTDHRHEVIVRRTEFDLRKAEERAHLLEGLLKALDHIDEIVELIKSSASTEEARNGLMTNFGLSELQAKAVLEMRLQRLTGLEREKIRAEYDELIKKIEEYREILANRDLRMQIIKDELQEMKDKYGDERRTQIVQSGAEINMEDIIPDEEMLITISNQGYIKRTALSEYKVQGRGGVGARGAATKDEDFTEHSFVATSHNYLLIFTDFGKVYWIKVYQLPEGSKTSKGKPIQNLVAVEKDEHVRAVINVRTLADEDYVKNNFLVFCTENGLIKKTPLEAYSRPRQNGINAITINEGDTLLDVKLTNGENEIIMGVRSGRAIRFNENAVRPMGRTAAGVRGIRLDDENDKVIGMVCVAREDAALLVVSEKGYGKRTSIEDYRLTNRGGKGVTSMSVSDKTGQVISIKEVLETDDLMIIKRSGIMIRIHVSDLRVMGRATQGVRLVRLSGDDEIAAVAKVEAHDDDDESQGAENQAPEDGSEQTEQED